MRVLQPTSQLAATYTTIHDGTESLVLRSIISTIFIVFDEWLV